MAVFDLATGDKVTSFQAAEGEPPACWCPAVRGHPIPPSGSSYRNPGPCPCPFTSIVTAHVCSYVTCRHGDRRGLPPFLPAPSGNVLGPPPLRAPRPRRGSTLRGRGASGGGEPSRSPCRGSTRSQEAPCVAPSVTHPVPPSSVGVTTPRSEEGPPQQLQQHG